MADAAVLTLGRMNPTCAFKAYHNTGTDVTISAGAIYPAATAIFNIGSHYNTSTYKFTAPRDGVYLFSWNAWSDDNSDVNYQMRLKVNTTPIFSSGAEGNGECFSTIVVLSAADTVNLEGNNSGADYWGGLGYNEFSGHYIGPSS